MWVGPPQWWPVGTARGHTSPKAASTVDPPTQVAAGSCSGSSLTKPKDWQLLNSARPGQTQDTHADVHTCTHTHMQTSTQAHMHPTVPRMHMHNEVMGRTTCRKLSSMLVADKGAGNQPRPTPLPSALDAPPRCDPLPSRKITHTTAATCDRLNTVEWAVASVVNINPTQHSAFTLHDPAPTPSRYAKQAAFAIPPLLHTSR